MKTLLTILLLSAAMQAQTFQGLYISAARTTPFDKWKRVDKSDYNLELTAIWSFTKTSKWSFHVEAIYPIGEKPLLRLAIARRVF